MSCPHYVLLKLLGLIDQANLIVIDRSERLTLVVGNNKRERYTTEAISFFGKWKRLIYSSVLKLNIYL